MANAINSNRSAVLIANSSLDPEKYFIRKRLNKMHPIPKEFFQLDNPQIVEIYSKLNPNVNIGVLQNCLHYESKYFHLGGSDLFHVKTDAGINKMILVEMNPGMGCRITTPGKNIDGYEREHVFWQNFMDGVTTRCNPTCGGLAVIYDAHFQCNLGNAVALAEISKENVWMVEYLNDDQNPPIKWVDGFLHIRDASSNWHPIRACYNSIGGSGLKIDTPKTKRNVKKEEISRIIEEMGGKAAVKVPYCSSGSGQGIYLILTPADFNEFMTSKAKYDNYIVQYLVTPYGWRDESKNNQNGDEEYFHVGTLKENGKSYVNDLRMIVASGKNGFSPLGIFSRRRAEKSIESVSDPESSTWGILGTNIAPRDGGPDGFDRVLICDEAEFPKYDMNLIDLVNAYVLSVLAVIAIDKLCQKCTTADEEFDFELFQSLNDDNGFLSEIIK